MHSYNHRQKSFEKNLHLSRLFLITHAQKPQYQTVFIHGIKLYRIKQHSYSMNYHSSLHTITDYNIQVKLDDEYDTSLHK